MFLFIFLLLPTLACDLFDHHKSHHDDYTTIAQLSDGVYGVAFGEGYAPEDEAKILAITAELRRSSGELIFTLADGTKKTVLFSPRPQEDWVVDCECVLDEVADVSPAPLQLESLLLSTPLVYAMCGPFRMVLSISTDKNAYPPILVFDLKR